MKRKQIVNISGPFWDGYYSIVIYQYDALPGECYPWKTEKRIIVIGSATAEEIGQLMGGN